MTYVTAPTFRYRPTVVTLQAATAHAGDDRDRAGALAGPVVGRRPSGVGGRQAGAVVDTATAFAGAGFTDLALVQIGGDREDDFLEAATELVAALRSIGTG